MLRPTRLRYEHRKNFMALNQRLNQRPYIGGLIWIALLMYLPYISAKVMRIADRLPIWE